MFLFLGIRSLFEKILYYFSKDLNNNKIYHRDNKKVCVGPYTFYARFINMQREKIG